MDTSVEPDVEQKYILIDVGGRFILRGDSTVQWHKEISEKLTNETSAAITVIGGGWIKLNSEEVQIEIWGESTKYGRADEQILRVVVSEDYPNYNLIFR